MEIGELVQKHVVVEDKQEVEPSKEKQLPVGNPALEAKDKHVLATQHHVQVRFKIGTDYLYKGKK